MISVINFNNNGICGKDGSKGCCGSHGVDGMGGRGGDGEDGENGGHGTHAGSIDVTLQSGNDDTDIVVSSFLSPRPFFNGSTMEHRLLLGDSFAEINLSARGGDGGHGGRGGNGGSGGCGYSGSDATRSSSGTNGGPGGNGGCGGDGGHGGSSGNGANIFIRSNQYDMDLLMLLKQRISCTEAGIAGRGGEGGSGGFGGMGGRGGNSYSWTESHTTRDSNGNTQTHHTHHSNSGGFSGSSGISGHSGKRGHSGIQGQSGVFRIYLTTENGVSEYRGPYNLQVSQIGFCDTVGYGILEPDCDVDLTVTHTNIGDMPTPLNQDIMSYVRDNEWVYCDPKNRVPMKRWIPEKSSSTLETPIRFHVKNFQQDPYSLPREPFVVPSTMDHEALVSRVNQSFKSVSDTRSPFNIEYPVQSSLIKGLSCITFGDEAPMVYSIWNKSARLGIGKHIQDIDVNSPTRTLFTRFRIHLIAQGGTSQLHPNDFILRDANGKVFKSPENGLIAEIPSIEPLSLRFFATTFQFTNPNIKPYTRILVESTLYLGHVQNMVNGAQPIQSRPFEIQLSEGYNPIDTNSEYLLITNNLTEYEEVQAWRQLIGSLGSSLNVWNLNLYKQLNLSFVRPDGRSLLQDFRCKTLIFLNSHFVRDEKLIDASTFIKARELMLAAHYHGIHTMIVGKNFNLQNELIPVFDGCSQSFYLSTKHFRESLTKRISFGPGDAQPLPANYSTNPSFSGPIIVNKKKRYVVLHHHLRTLLFYKSETDLYPEKSIYLDRISIHDDQDDHSFKLTLLSLEQSLVFKALPEKSKTLGTQLIPSSKRLNDAIRSIPPLSNSNNANTNDEQPIPLSAIEGYLKIRSGNSNGSGRYSKLYFVFNPLHKTLIQYDSHSKSNSKKKIIDLHRFSVTRANQFGNEECDHQTTFQIITTQKTFYFKTNTIEDCRQWVAKLSEFSLEYYQIRSEPSSLLKDAIINNIPDARGPSISPNSHIIENKIIPIIPIKERFIFGSPSEKHLVRHAERLSRKLCHRFPNQRNVVVYEYRPVKLSTFQYSLGTLEVHRSLDQTTNHIVQLLYETDQEIHQSNSINNPTTTYNLLKTLDFRTKLKLLDSKAQILENEGRMENCFSVGVRAINLLVLAIVSDIANEEWHLRYSKWRDQLTGKQISHSFVSLNILKRFEFQSLKGKTHQERIYTVLGDVLIEIQMHLELIKTAFKSIADTLLFRRRGTDVNSAISSLWQEITAVHLNGDRLVDDKPKRNNRQSKSLQKDEREHLKNRLQLKKTTWETKCIAESPNWGYIATSAGTKVVKNKFEIIQSYRMPMFSKSIVDSSISIPNVFKKSEFTSFYVPPSQEVVDFTGLQENMAFGDDNTARSNYISKIQKEQLGCLPENLEKTRLIIHEEQKPQDDVPYVSLSVQNESLI
eukprot:gene1279-1613_t